MNEKKEKEDNEIYVNIVPRMLVTITDRDECRRVEDILREKHVRFHYMFNAMGTASSEMLKAFGLSGTEKTVCICVEPAIKIKTVMTAVVERLELTHPGNGIAFVVPISGVSSIISNTFSKEILSSHREELEEYMQKVEKTEKELEEAGEQSSHELIVSVISKGFSEVLMDAAKAAGARGGTIVSARRTGLEDAVKFFGVSLQAEKEIVAILVHKSIKKELMQAINKACGMRTEARGIVISLPVDSCAGIATSNEEISG